LPALAADLVRRQVAVIASPVGTASALAAKAATTIIPHRLRRWRGPRQAWSCRQPRPAGRQPDRDHYFNNELVAKRLEFLRELVPAATRVAVLVNPANTASAESTLRDVEAAARDIGLKIQVLNDASTSREINAAFATFVRERPETLFVSGDPFFNSRPIGPPGDAPKDPRDIFAASICRNRRTDELRN
jgi:putative tryptophan/tyrosine transport system substrate-binding protein